MTEKNFRNGRFESREAGKESRRMFRRNANPSGRSVSFEVIFVYLRVIPCRRSPQERPIYSQNIPRHLRKLLPIALLFLNRRIMLLFPLEIPIDEKLYTLACCKVEDDDDKERRHCPSLWTGKMEFGLADMGKRQGNRNDGCKHSQPENGRGWPLCFPKDAPCPDGKEEEEFREDTFQKPHRL